MPFIPPDDFNLLAFLARLRREWDADDETAEIREQEAIESCPHEFIKQDRDGKYCADCGKAIE